MTNEDASPFLPLRALVQTAISNKGWVSFPEEADFSWGALIVAP